MAPRVSLVVSVLLLSNGIASAQDATDPGLFPDARPGACYTRVFVPPPYVERSDKIIRHEASHRLEVFPAQFESAEQLVEVKEATTTFEVIPPEFEWIDEPVVVKEATTKLVEVPPVYETITEKVVDRPEHQAWRKGRGAVERVDASTGEIVHQVTVPPTYKAITKTVVKSPARTEEVPVPAEYAIFRKQVVSRPAQIREVEIPAEYQPMDLARVVKEPWSEAIDVPAEYQTIRRHEKLGEGHMAWREILCVPETTRPVVRRIQGALQRAGFDPGLVDGDLGPATLEAVRQFQEMKGLAQGGLTMETIDALGGSALLDVPTPSEDEVASAQRDQTG